MVPLARLAGALSALVSAIACAQPAPAFDIMEYEIDGNTVLPVQSIEAAVTPFLGPGRGMGDVEGARAALEKVYQTGGFLTVFVDVPEQQVAEGVVRLHVTEGRVAQLGVSGSRYFSQGWILARVPELAEDKVPNFNVVQAQLATVNRSEDRRVQPVLRPGREAGTVDVDLKVADRLPLGASVELNNEHAADTTPWRLSAALHYDNLFQRDHSLTLNAIVAPAAPAQSKALVANYSVPLANGNSVVLYGVNSDSNVETLGGTSVLGKGTTVGARYLVPLATDSGYHSLSFGFDLKNIKQRVRQGEVGVDTPLRYLPFLLAYNGSWLDGGASTQLSATFTGALQRLLRRTVDDCPRADGTFGPADQFSCSRYNADGSFATFRLDGRHTEPLWAGSALSLRLAGQWANEPLVSGEQFALGGADSVRGYLTSAALGDHALLGSLELRSASFARRVGLDDKDGATSLSALAFVDAGRASIMDALPGQVPRQTLIGTGLGLRFNRGRRIDGGLDIAWAQRATPRQAAGTVRVHARMAVRF